MTLKERLFMLGGIGALQGWDDDAGKGVSVADLAAALREARVGQPGYEDSPLACLVSGSHNLLDFPPRLIDSLDRLVGQRHGDYVLTHNGESGECRTYRVDVA